MDESQTTITVNENSKKIFDHGYKEILNNNPYFSAGGGLMLLGSALALLRLGVKLGSTFLYRQILVNLEITSKDKSFQWFLEWMSQHKKTRSKNLSIKTIFCQHDNGSVSTKFSLVPGPGKHLIQYKGAFMFINRERSGKIMDLASGTPFETVTITTFFKFKNLFPQLLSDARNYAMRSCQGKTVIYVSWGSEWRPFGNSKKKRMFESVILDKDKAKFLFDDVKTFLKSEKWYHDRGIPYRRGYLLHGPPGSGKTSFVKALAGELDYNICLLSLSENSLTDDRLNHLINNIPKNSILLLEDIDSAFKNRKKNDFVSNGLSFSGLLNALDGVASADECITFMTTNHLERLDPALLRPGRIDVKMLLDNATEYQIRQMFLRFYENENTYCEEFIKKFKFLNLKNISTAQLQGFFVINRESPIDALNLIELLKTNL